MGEQVGGEKMDTKVDRQVDGRVMDQLVDRWVGKGDLVDRG